MKRYCNTTMAGILGNVNHPRAWNLQVPRLWLWLCSSQPADPSESVTGVTPAVPPQVGTVAKDPSSPEGRFPGRITLNHFSTQPCLGFLIYKTDHSNSPLIGLW